MPYMVIRHQVEDYAKWKTLFDEHGATRKANGSKGALLLRNADDPSVLVIVMEWDDLARAKEFAGSDNLREVMGRAGVTDHPDIYFCDEVERQAQ